VSALFLEVLTPHFHLKNKKMKAVFIIFNQAITNKVEKALELAQIKGFSKWNEMVGAGSNEGEPHLGTHVWPSLNSGIFTVLEDEKVKTLLNLIEQINNIAEAQGIHAFVWNIETMV
jgi:nitrogen regulatory protein PII